MTPSVYATLFLVLGIAIMFATWTTARHLSSSRQAKAEITGSDQYRAIADEYRRLSDLAITAQEHLDLRLTDISVRLDQLQSQMNQLQHILKEVE